MPSTINASNGPTSGLISTGDASGVLTLQTNNGVTALTLGTDQSATFASKVTITGTTSSLGLVLTNMAEVTTVSATAAIGTITYDVTTQSVLYYTVAAAGNWSINFRASSGTTLNAAMATGQAITVAFLSTNGPTAYYNNNGGVVVQVDGVSITPKYQGGTAWTGGNASSIDVYVYTIIKTGSAAFTVLASQTKYA